MIKHSEPDLERNAGASNAPASLSEHLTSVFKNSLEAADAQWAICTLKISRAMIVTVFCIAIVAAMTIVAVYGLFLLDVALKDVLNQPTLPVWFSPLIRGVAYISLSLGVVAYIFHSMVGSSMKEDVN
jgi:hypothetical protein